VLTDGDDTDSLHTLPEVVAAAQRSEVQIYPLTIHPKKVFSVGDRVLQRLADSTGGRFYVAASSKDLGEAFAQIERDLRTQYYISFPPQQSVPGYHSLRVEVRAPEKLEVHARQGYYALEQ
jgi:VWFA-related protein